ncbi:MAG: aminopeptidase P family protein [Acidobacteria bacterium]|nr:aminopeptidase P family protein [Acidobacteriota bacterium]
MIETAAKLRAALDESAYDWLALGSKTHIGYSTGYRSVAGDLFESHRMLVLMSGDQTFVVGGASDGAAAFEAGISAETYIPFGTFYFESVGGEAPESQLTGRHESFQEAVTDAMSRANIAGRVGFDAGASDLAPAISSVGAEPLDATDWMYDRRAVKLPEEVERLRVAARLAEQGIDAAIETAGAGISELELAKAVATTMAAGGGFPRFTVVTSGPRSAFSDARPTNRVLRQGDLVRFDVGCTFEGYWSDIGRTAVVGEPNHLVASRYAAILAGEEAQLQTVRPGISAEHLFDVAVSAVEDSGLIPYRRQHCGHAIGTEVYERPVVAPAWPTVLESGMVFCFETPYYEIGWGGMMVEDALVVTADGADMLTVSDRSLRVIEP